MTTRKELFDELLAEFRTEWHKLGHRLFNLEWHSTSGHSSTNPPYDPQEREPVGIVHLPMDAECETFTLMDVVTLPRADRLAEPREAFKRLAATAGAHLPAEFREALADYWSPDVVNPASWWYALLFRLEGSVAFWPDGRFRENLVLDNLFLRSIYAIEVCGLNTDNPVAPVKEGTGPGFGAEDVASQLEDVAPALNKQRGTVITVDKWEDLAIGIDENSAYLAVTPYPDCGGVFPMNSAVELDLPGDQWNNLLHQFATSENGNTAKKRDLLIAFGYAKARNLPVDKDDQQDLTKDAKAMQILRNADRQLSKAMADLGRRLRNQVESKDTGKTAVISASEAEIIRSRFVVRHLLHDESGKLRFGEVGFG